LNKEAGQFECVPLIIPLNILRLSEVAQKHANSEFVGDIKSSAEPESECQNQKNFPSEFMPFPVRHEKKRRPVAAFPVGVSFFPRAVTPIPD
jgi:hypothetical protein